MEGDAIQNLPIGGLAGVRPWAVVERRRCT